MHNEQSNTPANKPQARLAIAVLAAFAMLATSGLFMVPAQAQGSAQFVFEGAGWGHGVGMSQNGARNAANAGIEPCRHSELLLPQHGRHAGGARSATFASISAMRR